MLGMFTFVAFRPPEGMTKFPVTNVHFQVNTAQGTVSTNLQGQSMMSVAPTSELEEEEL